MQIKKIDIYDLIIDPDNLECQLTNIDAVDRPAIERDFLTFSEQTSELLKFKNDAVQRVATGAVLVPNRLIRRYNELFDYEYYVRIDEKNIDSAMKIFARDWGQHNQQLNHEGEQVNGVYSFESWKVRDSIHDASYVMGFKHVPVGTWFVSTYFQNEMVWNDYIATGKLKGWSIQGRFEMMLSQIIDVPFKAMFSEQKMKLQKDVKALQLSLSEKK